jgi:hypothetical protein
MLADARALATEIPKDPWEFAVEIGQMRAAGITHSDLRWMVSRQWIEHAWEIRRSKGRRAFRTATNLSFPESTCFVLTTYGANILTHGASLRPGPWWDWERRELRLNGYLVKRFARPAANQEYILGAFEECGWPARISDPLPPDPHLDPTNRLHEAVKRLNQGQTRARMKFRRDGTGRGIIWEAA